MFQFFKRSIKNKLIGIQILTSVILLVLFVSVYIFLEVQDFRDNLRRELNAAAGVLSFNAAPTLVFNDAAEAQLMLRAMEGYDNILNAWISNEHGQLFAMYSKPGAEGYVPVASTAEQYHFYRDEILFSRQIVHEGQLVGALFFRISTAAYYQKLMRILIVVVVVMLIGVFLSYFVANYSQRAISLPIIGLNQTFEEFRLKKDFSLRVKHHGDDEIGRLYEGFNALAGELQFYSNNLEVLVAARTKSLEESNLQLQNTSKAFELMNYALKDEINQRIKTEQSLKASEEKMRIILQTMEEGVTVYTARQILFVNAAFCRLLGYEPQEIEGMPTEEISRKLIHPEDYVAVTRAAEAVMKSHRLRRMEYRYMSKNGQEVWVSGMPAIIPWDEEEAIIATVVDITQHKKDKLDLQKAKEAAETANKAKSTFLANMSHEIRTPLNAVMGYSQILQRDPQLNERQRGFVVSINKSGEHLLSLINDILDMSKIEAGHVQLFPTPFSLDELVFDLADLFRLKADEKNLKLEIQRDPALPAIIRADQGRIRQIIINLIGNAIKFSSKGVISCTFYTPVRNLMAVDIADEGSGIPEHLLEHIFQPFEQAHSNTVNAGGTGLGLSISRKLARMMGGDITVKSQIDKGSVFTLSFLYEAAEGQLVAPAPQKHTVRELAPESRNTRVLIVDDKHINRHVLLQLLQPLGFELNEAENGLKALEVFKQWKPHIIIMDIVMPLMDGREATRRIRAEEAGKDVVIIAVTASALDEERAEIMRLGVNDFVRKPFKEAELLESMSIHGRLHYLFDDAAETNKATKDEKIDFSSIVSQIPDGVIHQTQTALELGDLDQLTQLAGEIGKFGTALSERMLQLIHEFKLEEIKTLLRLK